MIEWCHIFLLTGPLVGIDNAAIDQILDAVAGIGRPIAGYALSSDAMWKSCQRDESLTAVLFC